MAAPDGGDDGGGSEPATYSAFPTGIDAGDGTDAHWTADGGILDLSSLTGIWSEQGGSHWVSPRSGSSNYNCSTTLTIPMDADLGSLAVTASAMVDNILNDVLVNGVSTGLGIPVDVGFLHPTILVFPTGAFVHGANTIAFVVENTGGPTGLNVKWV